MTEIPGETLIYPQKWEILLGKSVCPIILGTSRFSAVDERDPITGYFKPTDSRRESEVGLVTSAVRSGMNVIDTAAAYGDSENVIGDAQAYLNRESVVIITKVGIKPVPPSDIRRSIERSRRRLGTVPDMIMIHNRWDSGDIAACIAQLNKAQDEGLTKSIGISNFRSDELSAAIAISKHPIAAYEAKLNLINPRKDFIDLKRVCDEHHIPFLASSSLDRGSVFQVHDNALLTELATKYHMTIAQLGIYAVLNIGALPIVQSHSMNHIRENLDTLKFGMDQKDIGRLTGMLLEKIKG